MGSFGFCESGVFEGVVVAGPLVLPGDSAGIGLSYLSCTSACHHLSPNLSPKATPSVEGICWAANGLMGAIALLKAAEYQMWY